MQSIYFRILSNCKLACIINGMEWDGWYELNDSGLGFVSIAFDLLFMTQHYILYRDRTDYYLSSVDEERRRLIVEGRVPREEDVE